MIRYLVKRVLLIFLIVLCVTFILFVLMYSLAASRIRLMPTYGGGDTLDAILGFINAGDNIVTKYVRYCYNLLFHLDFGRASSTGYYVTAELGVRTGTTLILLACSAAATFVIGIPAGIYAAMRKDGLWDRVINVTSLLLASIPNYSLALIIALVFVLYLGILPMSSMLLTPASFIMPTLVIALGGISSIARMTRSSMVDVLEQPYITALRSKGLKERRVIFRHALKNALVPVISVLGGFISQLLCGAFVAEHFFNLRGLGSYMLRSAGMRDHYEILGCTVIMTVILAALNIAADVLYAVVNPQIRRRYAKATGSVQGKGWSLR